MTVAGQSPSSCWALRSAAGLAFRQTGSSSRPSRCGLVLALTHSRIGFSGRPLGSASRNSPWAQLHQASRPSLRPCSLVEPLGLPDLAQAAIGRGQRKPHGRLGELLEPGPLDLLPQRHGALEAASPLRIVASQPPRRLAAGVVLHAATAAPAGSSDARGYRSTSASNVSAAAGQRPL